MGVVLEAKLFSEEDSDEAKLYGSCLVNSASSAKVTEVRFLGAVVQFCRWAYSKDKSIRRWSSRVSEVKEQRLVRSLESRSTDDGGEEEKTSCGKISLPISFYTCRTVSVGVEFVFVSLSFFVKRICQDGTFV